MQVIAVSAPLTGSLAAFHFRFHGRQPVSANPPPNTSLASPCFATRYHIQNKQNQVLTGDAILNLRAISEDEILDAAKLLFSNFKVEENIDLLSQFGNTRLSEQQFCNLLGRGRMYAVLPKAEQKQISEIPLLLSDTQMGSVAKEYHRNKHFHKSDDGSIDLWRFHNLLTEANKSSYIDTFIERAANATDFTKEIAKGIESASSNSGWFLN